MQISNILYTAYVS